MTNLDFAVAYACLGWKVFPLAQRSKIPLSGSHGHLEATNDVERVRAIWSANPKANIAIFPYPSGIVAVDVDVKHGDGFADLEGLEIVHGSLPETLVNYTPSGGKHFIFRSSVPLGNHKIAPNIDIRSAEGYIAAEPSVVDGKQYNWLDWDVLSGEVPEIAELPQWVIELSLAAAKRSITNGSSGEDAPKFEPVRNEDIPSLNERLQAFLAHAPRAMYRWDGGKDGLRDTSGSAMDISMVAMLKAAGFTYSEAVTLMANWPHGSSNNQRAGERYWQRAWVNSSTNAPAPPVPIDLSALRVAAPPPTIQTPPDLLNPPGIVGVVTQWVEQTARKTQPQFSVQAALAFAATVLGRRYVTDQRNWPSLYFLNIGKSASGKEHAKWAIEKALDACNLGQLIGPASYTSDSGLLSTLARQPSHITIIDEFGKVLEDASVKSGSRSSSTMRALMEAWGRCDGTMRPQGYSTFGLTERDIEKLAERTVRNPAVTLLAMTTPETLFDTIGMAAVRDGFLNRFLIVETDIGRQKSRSIVPDSLPDEVIEWAAAMRSATNIVNPDTNASLEPTPQVVPIAYEASYLFDKFEEECIDLMNAHEKDGLAEMFGRTREISMRISLIIALGSRSEAVEAPHAAWAINYTRYYAQRVVERLKGSIGDSEFDALKRQVYDIILRAGTKGCTIRDLVKASRKFAKIDKREQANALESLAYIGDVALVTQKLLNGRERTSWVAVEDRE